MRTLSHRDAVLVLYAVACSFGLAAVTMSLMPPVYGLGVIGCVCVLTGVGLNRLKYLRRSYVEPDVHAIGRAAGKETGGSLSSERSNPAELRELAVSNGDGGVQAVEVVPAADEDSGRGRRLAAESFGASRAYDISGAAS